jgi:hypothetical protein
MAHYLKHNYLGCKAGTTNLGGQLPVEQLPVGQPTLTLTFIGTPQLPLLQGNG